MRGRGDGRRKVKEMRERERGNLETDTEERKM